MENSKNVDVNQDPIKILQQLIKMNTASLGPYQKGVNKRLEEMGMAHTDEAVQGGIDPRQVQSQAGLDHKELLSNLLQSGGVKYQPAKGFGKIASSSNASLDEQGNIVYKEGGMFDFGGSDLAIRKAKALQEMSSVVPSEVNIRNAQADYYKNGGMNKSPEFGMLDSEQQIQAYDLARKIGGVRGAKNILPSIVDQLNNGIPIDQIEDKLRYSQQSENTKDEWRGAAQSILSKSSLTQTNKQIDALDDYLQKGDIEGGKDYLKRISLEQAPVEQREKIMGKERTIDLLDNIQQDINTLRKNGENTGFITGNLEGIYSRIGKVKNPEMRKVATKIAAGLIAYRQSMTGAAFSQLENSEYKKVFPSIDKVGDFNDVNINALREVFSGDTNKFYEQSMGASNYNKIFNSDSSSKSSGKSSFRVIGVE